MDTAIQRIDVWIKDNNPGAYLNVADLNLTQLSPIPDTCCYLNCSRNKLTHLPPLPNCISLSCDYNLLQTLPDLPNCEHLSCENNLLTTLPDLPKCKELTCCSNKLTSLPELPNCISLDCGPNDLTHLPQLPKCTYVDCRCNNLVYLPPLPHIIAPPIIWIDKHSMHNMNNNWYLHIKPRQLARLIEATNGNSFYNQVEYYSDLLKPTPNYNKCAKIIQRNYKVHIRKKYKVYLQKYISKDPAGIVCLYVV